MWTRLNRPLHFSPSNAHTWITSDKEQNCISRSSSQCLISKFWLSAYRGRPAECMQPCAHSCTTLNGGMSNTQVLWTNGVGASRRHIPSDFAENVRLKGGFWVWRLRYWQVQNAFYVTTFLLRGINYDSKWIHLGVMQRISHRPGTWGISRKIRNKLCCSSQVRIPSLRQVMLT